MFSSFPNALANYTVRRIEEEEKRRRRECGRRELAYATAVDEARKELQVYGKLLVEAEAFRNEFRFEAHLMLFHELNRSCEASPKEVARECRGYSEILRREIVEARKKREDEKTAKEKKQREDWLAGQFWAAYTFMMNYNANIRDFRAKVEKMLLWEPGQREAYFYLAKQVDPSIDTEEKLKNYLVELYRKYTLAPLYKLFLKDNPYNWLAWS